MNSHSKARAGPSVGSRKQQLWVSCAGRAAAKLHLGFILDIQARSWSVGFCLEAPQAPLAKLQGSTKCPATPLTALPTLQAAA